VQVALIGIPRKGERGERKMRIIFEILLKPSWYQFAVLLLVELIAIIYMLFILIPHLLTIK